MFLHFVKPLVCPLCHVQISQQKCLDRHMKTCHSKGRDARPPKKRAIITRVKRLREATELRIPEDLAKAYPASAVPVNQLANDLNNESCVLKVEPVVKCKSEEPLDQEGRVELEIVNLDDSNTFAAQTAAVSALLEREGVRERETQGSENNVEAIVKEEGQEIG